MKYIPLSAPPPQTLIFILQRRHPLLQRHSLILGADITMAIFVAPVCNTTRLPEFRQCPPHPPGIATGIMVR